jgi:hypothetical protein
MWTKPLVNERYRFIFCPIPKNANTSMCLWFLNTLGVEICPGMKIHEHVRKNYSILNYGPTEIQHLLDTYYKFSIVRNPWSRIVSAFAEKFLCTSLFKISSLQIFHGIRRAQGYKIKYDTTIPLEFPNSIKQHPADSSIDYERGVTFLEFVDFICSQNDDEMDIHWKPQWTFMDGFEWDFIGHVESLNQDFQAICQKLGTPEIKLAHRVKVKYEKFDSDKNLANVPSSMLCKNLSAPLPSQLWTDDLLNKIAVRYHKDIQLFGYEKYRPLPAN